ncbi:hypothetical protein CDAR_542771 [Caerostris darwini]|uniref:Uncharacterized protein n=1 Tax=Caerostris darwini TaxID=1538125 RepID=A0AAV4WX43_9ARAC|nr:hypothetical protein CDAR_542771 [Caerostris darwini]
MQSDDLQDAVSTSPGALIITFVPPPARSPLPFPLEASAVSGHTLALLLDTVQWSLQCPVLQITTISNGKGIKYSSSILP